MRLRILGALAVDGSSFSRPKPLLHLAYPALEGSQVRRHLAELFWPQASDRRQSSRVALAHIRRGCPGAIVSDDHRLHADVVSDAEELLGASRRADAARVAELCQGSFAEGIDPGSRGLELGEWVYTTREHLATRARLAMIELAERGVARGRLVQAGSRAVRAHRLAAAPPPGSDETRRLHAILTTAQVAEAHAVRHEAEELGREVAFQPAALPARPARKRWPRSRNGPRRGSEGGASESMSRTGTRWNVTASSRCSGHPASARRAWRRGQDPT